MIFEALFVQRCTSSEISGSVSTMRLEAERRDSSGVRVGNSERRSSERLQFESQVGKKIMSGHACMRRCKQC